MNNEKLNEAVESGAWYAFFGSPDFLMGSAAVGGIVATIKLIQSNTIKGRFQKCVKILYKMQKDFGTAEKGMDLKTILPGVGSALMDWVSRLFTFKGRDKNKNKGALGLRPFVDNYVNEITLDYQQALNAYNTIVIGSQMAKKNKEAAPAESKPEAAAAAGESLNIEDAPKIYESFAAAFADETLNEGVTTTQQYVNISEGIFLGKKGNTFATTGQDGAIREIAITPQSVREVCYSIFNLFFAKYFNLKSVFEKLGINSLEDVDMKNVDNFQKVAKRFAEANAADSTGNSKMYKRVQDNYNSMVDSYGRIGDSVIKNFKKFSEQKYKGNDGKQMTEKEANLLTASVEKLTAELNRQKDGYKNNFNRVLLAITSSPAYIKFIDFILKDVIDVFKEGAAENAKPILDKDALPAPGTYVVSDETVEKETTTKEGEKKVKTYKKLFKVKRYDETDASESPEESKPEVSADQGVELEPVGYIDAEAVKDNDQYIDLSAVTPEQVEPETTPEGEQNAEGNQAKPEKLTIRQFFGRIFTGKRKVVKGISDKAKDKLENGTSEKPTEERKLSDIKVFGKQVRKKGVDVNQYLFVYLQKNETNDERQKRLAAKAEEKKAEPTEEAVEPANEAVDIAYAKGQNAIAKQRQENFRVANLVLLTGDVRTDISITSELYYDAFLNDLKTKGVVGEGDQSKFAEITDEEQVKAAVEKVEAIKPADAKQASKVEEVEAIVSPRKPSEILKANQEKIVAEVEKKINDVKRQNGGSLFKEISDPETNTAKIECVVPKSTIVNKYEGEDRKETELIEIPTGLKTSDWEEDIVILIHPVAVPKQEEKPDNVSDATANAPEGTENISTSVQEAEGETPQEQNANPQAEQPQQEQPQTQAASQPAQQATPAPKTSIADKYDFSYLICLAIKADGYYVSKYNLDGHRGIYQLKEPLDKADLVDEIDDMLYYYEKHPNEYIGEGKFTIKYDDFFNLAESFMGTLSYLKVNRQIVTDKKVKEQYYVLSENAWGDGIIREPEKYLTTFTNTYAKACKTYDDFASLAKSSTSINFMPLTEDCSYKTRLPYNRFGMLTESNPLYESTLIVSFNEDNTVKNIINLGISKIAK